MTDDIAIKVTNLSKSFRLPHEKHSGLKQKILSFGRGGKGFETQHVLKDISFEIKKGEFFGIVGRNGSGKSTLLKTIAGIYSPDKGKVTVNGKLVPFIELGVGFNPELTGRENVYLNGALLGFSRKEMDAMYDEIVTFAELERFMDQKLKNYSSGMQVRLAFSIAIRAKGDILIMDEVLAVGDTVFQHKCYEHFRKLKREGKTVILVTHNMTQVEEFCNRAALVRDGKIVILGSPVDVTNQYIEDNLANSTIDTGSNDSQQPLSLNKLVPHFKVTPKTNQILHDGDDMVFEIEYKITDDIPVHIAFSIIDNTRDCVVMANRSEAISGAGPHKLMYRFPTELYNDTDFTVKAVMDIAGSLERIAYTSENDSCRFILRNKFTFASLIKPIGPQHGNWQNVEELIIDKNGRRVK